MRKTGIVVEPAKGQAALSVLTELELVDHNYKIKRATSRLRIPLSRRPSKEELETIEDKIGEFSTSMDDYESLTRRGVSFEEALSLLPPEARQQVPRAFDIIGDLAILELTPELEPFKRLIAGTLMDVQRNVRAVYGKAGPISGEERVRPLTHLAGETRTLTTHREFGSNFRVDIARVFFSPRLSQEHSRVAEQVKLGERVIDMFAGVGPYSILIARSQKDVMVDAVDINPDATRLMQENVMLNHVQEKVKVWNGNARDIIQTEGLVGIANRVIMNHPSGARQFLDTAVQALRPSGGVIHFYTFREGVEAEHAAVAELEENLERVDWNIEQTLLVRKVRGVSPKAWQIVVDAQAAPA